MTRELKLYVWEGVFTDYTSGMAVALAYDVRQARRLVTETMGSWSADWVKQELAGRPQVIRLNKATKPQAWQVSGGS